MPNLHGSLLFVFNATRAAPALLRCAGVLALRKVKLFFFFAQSQNLVLENNHAIMFAETCDSRARRHVLFDDMHVFANGQDIHGPLDRCWLVHSVFQW